ncbi:MFS transporter [Amycolatopsis sp. NPDC059021]|uniref:MFS transporter n=1 Tax=Amycolatopsis sp. NPDC059021 TaxID=3346704 RepID=UPI003671FFBA
MIRLREAAGDVLAGGGGPLLAATLVQSAGQGAAMACNTVFFVTVVGLAPGDVGLTYSAGTAVAMAFAVVAGRLADRWGARNAAVWLSISAGVAVAAYSLVTDLLGFALVQLLVASLRMGKQIGENALVGQLAGNSARFRAYQRSVLNIGMSLGTLAAAIPLYLNDRGAYLAVVFGNAAVLAIGGLLVRAVPGAAVPRGRRAKRDWRALRDVRYVVVGLLTGLLEIRDSVLTIAVPLWLAGNHHVPRPLVALLLFTNTAMVIVLQVWAARGANAVRGAAVTMRRGATALALSCAVFGTAPYLAGAWALAVPFAAIVVFTLGEMWTAAGGWTLSYELADPAAHGEYQGVFEMTSGTGLLLGPVVATTVALAAGGWGWPVIGAGFLVAGLLAEQVVVRSAPAVPAASTAERSGS